MPFEPTPAADFNRTVQLQRQTSVQGPDGETVQVWKTYAAVRASMKPTAGKWLQLAQANATANVRTSTIVIRYGPTVQITDRILYGTRTFKLNMVANAAEANRELHLTATEDLSP